MDTKESFTPVILVSPACQDEEAASSIAPPRKTLFRLPSLDSLDPRAKVEIWHLDDNEDDVQSSYSGRRIYDNRSVRLSAICSSQFGLTPLASLAQGLGDYMPEVPEGGYGWWVVFASFLSHFIVNGSIYTFGVFLQHYSNDLFKGKASFTTLSFVGTLQSSSMSLFGLLSGVLTDKLGYKTTLFMGNFLLTLGLAIASLSQQVWSLFLSHGLLCGIGASLVYFPIVSAPSHWFWQRRGLALGVAVAGSGAGGLVLSPAIETLIDSIGVRWTLRFLAFTSFLIVTIVGLLLRLPPQYEIKQQRKKSDSTAVQSIEAGLEKPTTLKGTILKLFKDRRFVLLLCMGFLVSLGYLAPFYLLPSYAVKIGLSSWQGALVGGVLSGASAFGRIGIGFSADYVGHINGLALCLAMSAISCAILWPIALNLGLLMTFAIIYGVFVGGFTALLPVVYADLFGVDDLATVTGIQNTSFGITTLVGTPIVTAIANGSGNFILASIFSGVMIFLAATAVGIIRLSISRSLKIKM